MRIIFSTACMALLLVSCGSPKTEKKQKTQAVAKTVQYPAELQGLLDHFPVVKAIAVDSVFFDDSLGDHSQFSLTPECIQMLTAKLAKDDFSHDETYYLNSFYKIAAAKQSHTYEQFEQKLDIGMTRDANCYAISRMEFGDSMAVLLWKISYSSYEACPYFSGTHVLATLIRDGKVAESILLGAHETSTDPPMGYEMYQLGNLQGKGVLKTRRYSETLEDETVIEKEKIRSVYSVGALGFEEN
jgi:hypothetical protein